MPRWTGAIFLALSSVLTGCATCAIGVRGVESREDLGGGFCIVSIARPSASTFEGIGHFQHCYYADRDLGACDVLSVAPTGGMAVWQDSTNRDVVLFRKGSSTPATLVANLQGRLDSVRWDLSAKKVWGTTHDHAADFSATIPDH